MGCLVLTKATLRLLQSVCEWGLSCRDSFVSPPGEHGVPSAWRSLPLAQPHPPFHLSPLLSLHEQRFVSQTESVGLALRSCTGSATLSGPEMVPACPAVLTEGAPLSRCHSRCILGYVAPAALPSSSPSCFLKGFTICQILIVAIYNIKQNGKYYYCNSL